MHRASLQIKKKTALKQVIELMKTSTTHTSGATTKDGKKDGQNMGSLDNT